ncbi:MAG TPA: non-ribosomal peptide synthetase, partial [Bryobacteraceae bacterium]|nr:non-ribosomal peptide synthetase [Bryobacteraceae bacterium]
MREASTAARAMDAAQVSCFAEVARWVREKPDATALLGPDQPTISFAILSARNAALVKMLKAVGIQRGDIVAVAMSDGPDLLSVLLAVGEVAAAAPLDWRLTAAEFRSRLTLLAPRALLVHSLSDGYGASISSELGVPAIEVQFLPSGELGAIPARLARGEQPPRAPIDCALVLQTSATTGDAKLVPLTHRNLYAICTGVAQCLDLQPQDRYLSIMPLHHILGYSSALAQLMVGGSAACTGFDARKFSVWIEDLAPTWYAAGPALHRAILEIARETPEPFHRSPLRFVRCGSGAGSTALFSQIEEVLRVKVVNGYGLTEVGPATNTPPNLPRKSGSVGRSIGIEIGIMDAQGNLLAHGAEGEVVLRGEAVMEGYLGSEEANRQVFLGGWFRTGDLGRLDSDGDLFITGRIKEMINRGGETISPLEVDHAVAEHPGVLRTACFPVPHPTLDEDIVAAVSLRPGYRATPTEIRAFLVPRLSRSKIPGRIWFTETIPVSASGKPLRNSLRESFLAASRERPSSPASAEEHAASGELRDRVAEVWTRILESEHPAPEDNFFGMGGDSLSAARLFAALEQDLQLGKNTLDLGRFLDSPNFQRLVEVVEQALRPGGSISSETFLGELSAVCLQPAGDLPPVFVATGEKSDPWPLRHLARALGGERPLYGLRHQLGSADRFFEMATQ